MQRWSERHINTSGNNRDCIGISTPREIILRLHWRINTLGNTTCSQCARRDCIVPSQCGTAPGTGTPCWSRGREGSARGEGHSATAPFLASHTERRRMRPLIPNQPFRAKLILPSGFQERFLAPGSRHVVSRLPVAAGSAQAPVGSRRPSLPWEGGTAPVRGLDGSHIVLQQGTR